MLGCAAWRLLNGPSCPPSGPAVHAKCPHHGLHTSPASLPWIALHAYQMSTSRPPHISRFPTVASCRFVPIHKGMCKAIAGAGADGPLEGEDDLIMKSADAPKSKAA